MAVITGRLPPDLGRWVLRQLAPPDRPERDALLRAAADRISGSRWTKAGTIADMLAELRAFPGLMMFVYGGDRAMHYVQAALRLDPATPGGVRQLLRILAD